MNNEIYFTASVKELEALINAGKLDDLSNPRRYKSLKEEGFLPFSLQPTYLENIRRKLNSSLHSVFPGLSEAMYNFVEDETRDQYHVDTIERQNKKIGDIKEKHHEELNNPDETERSSYYLLDGSLLSKYQRRINVEEIDLGNPSKVPFLALPKMTVMQMVKNSARRWDKLEKITDNTLISFVEKLDNSQFAKLLKLIQKRLDEKDRDYIESASPPIFGIDNDDDFIIENAEPDVSPKRR